MFKRLGLLLLPTVAAVACAANGTGESSSAESTAVATAPTATSPAASLRPVHERSSLETANPYTLFETLQVRPLAISNDGKTLYALNTPDNRLEIFQVSGSTLQSVGSVEVGLEPVAVALRNNNEVWVVNHLSDSVSIVTIDSAGPRVTRTLLVGDEPRDIVFGGPAKNLAFITTAHRGQNSPDDPDLFAPGAGRADVWVFDGNNLGTAPGGTRVTKLTFFADTPRALAASRSRRQDNLLCRPFFSSNWERRSSPTATCRPPTATSRAFRAAEPVRSSSCRTARTPPSRIRGSS